MKSSALKLSVLAVFVLAGGAMTTVQAANASGEVYDVNFSIYNNTPICAVYGLPTVDLSNGSVNVLDYGVSVDGAGKITGYAHLQLTTDTGSSTAMATVTGKMGMKGSSPVVNMTVKGPGYTGSGGQTGKSSVNMKFSGTPVYVNNTVGAVSYSGYEMHGNVNGSFKPGIQSAQKVQVKNAAGTISSQDVDGMTQIDSCSLALVAVNNKLTLGGCLDDGDGDLDFHYDWNGTGKANLNNGKFNFKLTGIGAVTGSTIALKGYSAVVNPTGDVNLSSVTASGKVMGQKIDGMADGYLTVVQ